MGAYWDKRRHWAYHQVAMGMVRAEHAIRPCRTVLDVGGKDCEYILCCDIQKKTRLDVERQQELLGVTDWCGDFNTAVFTEPFDVVVCLEVLEHIPNARWFAQRLLRLATRLVVISAPFCWQAGAEPAHVHDPIDLAKLMDWTGRACDTHQIVGASAAKFLVAEYHA